MIKEKAYAKINLFLNVLSKRKDGFHDLEMVMAPLDYFDELRFVGRKDNEIIVNSDTFITEDVLDNLVYQIAFFMKEEFKIETGVTIDIKKRIPLGAGLAGGSADGAATIRGLNRLWKLNLSDEDMAKIGETFGSDIPFCIYNKLAIVKGRGEVLEFINACVKGYVLLVNPNIHVSTKEVFSFVKTEDLVEKKTNKIVEALKNKDLEGVSKNLYNYLETITFTLKPPIRGLKNSIKNLGVEGVLMSGSGSTVFVINKRKNTLAKISKMIDPGFTIVLTKLH